MKYTIIAEEDGRVATQYIESQRPLDTLDVGPVNVLVAPELDKEYWDEFRSLVEAELKEG